MCSRFVTGMCNQLFDDDELCFRASGIAQMFQYSETILVLPVVQYSAQKEDGNILLLRRLRVEEVVALGTKCKLQLVAIMEVKSDEPCIFTRPDPSASGMFFCQNCYPYPVRHM